MKILRVSPSPSRKNLGMACLPGLLAVTSPAVQDGSGFSGRSLMTGCEGRRARKSQHVGVPTAALNHMGL